MIMPLASGDPMRTVSPTRPSEGPMIPVDFLLGVSRVLPRTLSARRSPRARASLAELLVLRLQLAEALG
jgi:hypothetical protein